MVYKLNAVLKRRSTKAILCGLLILIFIYTYFGYNADYEGIRQTFLRVREEQSRRTHFSVINNFVKEREGWETSNLGSWLFKYDAEVTPRNKTFSILVWKYLAWLSARHIRRYGSDGHDPLDGCSVKNCIFTGENDKLATADAVIVHLQHGDIPKVDHRDPKQRWIFLNDESPKNAFSLARKTVHLKDLANVFNWSMTYRSIADIPVPYGRTIALHEPVFKTIEADSIVEIIPNWKKKRRDVLATILISNCGVKFRIDFIAELQKHMSVDMYGGCAKNTTNRNRCPGHFRSDCEPISEYLFYLALENSGCSEYLTEKIWYHAYMKGAIPIIMGPSLSDCKRLLPPNSYIYVPMNSNAVEIKEIADNIKRLSEDDDALLSLHQWRNHFEVFNEHGYFGTESFHLCRVCEAMNYNDMTEKVYSKDDLKKFLDARLLC